MEYKLTSRFIDVTELNAFQPEVMNDVTER